MLSAATRMLWHFSASASETFGRHWRIIEQAETVDVNASAVVSVCAGKGQSGGVFAIGSSPPAPAIIKRDTVEVGRPRLMVAFSRKILILLCRKEGRRNSLRDRPDQKQSMQASS